MKLFRNKKLMTWLGLCFCLSPIFFLHGCAARHPIHYTTVAPMTLEERRALYIEHLRDAGIQVIAVGETMRFVLMSDDLFNADSANLRAENRPTLTVLADLMHTYDKVNVTVTAYSDARSNVAREIALTTRQAQVIASFLWAHDIDARLISAVGYGRQNAVDTNATAMGRHDNRRVEVSFRFYPVYVPYA